jgi:hypothetical protein
MLAVSDVELLVDDLASFEHDPLGFVMWAFPWGEAGTSLADEEGPELWQREHLIRIGNKLRAGGDLGAVIEEDVSAGHGVGKSAAVAWIILWAVSTHEHTRGVVTANTDTQLRTKTWAELGKWFQMFVARDLFVLTATAVYSSDKGADKTWRIDQIPWSKERSEAFAGLHNKGRRILVLFDEASAIDDLIWEVTEGALTDERTQIIWCRYGNPTRTSGQFHRRCMQPKRNHYTRVDSRQVRFTNKGQIEAWITEYGEDSDFVRVRVKGQFPRAGMSNFISYEAVEAARRRMASQVEYGAFPKVLSVDPARFGDDFSVITLRQGSKVHWQRALAGFDGPDLAGRVMEICRREPEIIAIVHDAVGNGADLDSALRRTPNLPRLVPVMWGVPAKDSTKYFNLRAECWGRMRDWLPTGDIPDHDALCNELTSVDYGYDAAMRIQLQSKKDIKRNGGKSPDHADSLALSFMLEAVELKGDAVPARRVRPANAQGWT